jgi:hypothetical protein
LVELDKTLYGGDAIAGNLDVTTFNSISSTILKCLRYSFVWWMHYLHHSALLKNELGLFSIVGFPRLHHTTSLADVTMKIKTLK